MPGAQNSDRNVRKILVIRFSSIGDIVQSTSVLEPLKSAYPNAHLAFMTREDFAPILESQPMIDELICVPRDLGVMKLRMLAHQLVTMSYDLVFDLHNSMRSRIILSFFPKERIFRVRKPRFNRWMLVQWHVNRFTENWSVRDMFFQPLRDAEISIPEVSFPKIVVTPEEKVLGLRMLRRSKGFREYVACLPGAAWPQKSFGLEAYLRTFDSLGNFPIVLLGSKKDTICFQLKEAFPGAINLAGQLTLRDSLRIIAGARVVVGSDTGMVHAAEAMGKSVVMILGPTTREMGAGSAQIGSTDIEVDLWCRPCSQNGKRPCYRREQYCLTSIDPVSVANSVRSAIL